MKVLDLKCGQQHVFEGWFGSEDDFQGQLAKGLVECPLCGSADIQKQLSAPRLNLGAQPPAQSAQSASSREDKASSNAAGESSAATQASGPASHVGQVAQAEKTAQALNALSTLASSPEQAQALHALQALQANYLQQVRKVMANTEDVGTDFAEVARQMHYGETEERNIRGQTTPAEAMALLEEGIPVMPLPIPDALKETLQ